MTICIVHDSELGNGERLANLIRERLNHAGHTATVGHERTLTPAEALASQPNLLIVGSAVRKFSLSPVTKRWIAGLSRLLREAGTEPSGSLADDAIPRAAIFVTHAMSSRAAGRWAARLRGRLVRALGEERVHPGWISARVSAVSGPFADGVEDAALRQIDAVVEWASGS